MPGMFDSQSRELSRGVGRPSVLLAFRRDAGDRVSDADRSKTGNGRWIMAEPARASARARLADRVELEPRTVAASRGLRSPNPRRSLSLYFPAHYLFFFLNSFEGRDFSYIICTPYI